MKTNLKTKPLKIEIVNRWRWEVVAPVSSVRIGETSKELVKKKQAVDYLRLVTIFVRKNEQECKRWVFLTRLVARREALSLLCVWRAGLDFSGPVLFCA